MQAMHPHKWRYVVVRQTAGLGGGGGGRRDKDPSSGSHKNQQWCSYTYVRMYITKGIMHILIKASIDRLIHTTYSGPGQFVHGTAWGAQLHL